MIDLLSIIIRGFSGRNMDKIGIDCSEKRKNIAK
jgi:hypothetical protein